MLTQIIAEKYFTSDKYHWHIILLCILEACQNSVFIVFQDTIINKKIKIHYKSCFNSAFPPMQQFSGSTFKFNLGNPHKIERYY